MPTSHVISSYINIFAQSRIIITPGGFINSSIAAEGRSARVDRVSGPIFLDDVGCSGAELQLTNCTNRGVGVHNCGNLEDAEVVCKGKLVE